MGRVMMRVGVRVADGVRGSVRVRVFIDKWPFVKEINPYRLRDVAGMC